MSRLLAPALALVAAVGAGVTGRPWVAAGLALLTLLLLQPLLLRPAPTPRARTRRPVHRRAGSVVTGALGALGALVSAVLAVVGTAVALIIFYLALTPLGLGARLLGLPLLPEGEWRRRDVPTGAHHRSAVKGPTGRPALSGKPAGARLTWRVAIALVVAGALAATLAPEVLDRSPDESAIPEQLRGATYNAFDAPALADADWKDDAGPEFSEASGGLTYTPYVGNSLRDYAGRYVNVTDRQRRSYEATLDAGGDPVDVWFFGGSTMFGFSAQRDDHTIPSEIVRLAEDDGVVVRAHNFGSPGYVNMQETALAAQLLAAGERPDLMVFYDGINDLGLQVQLGFGGIGTAGDPSDLSAFAFRELLAGQVTGTAEPPSPIGPVPDMGRPPSADATITALEGVYERGIELAGALGEHYGVPVAHFWQPDLFNTAPLEPGEQEVVRRLGMDEFQYDSIVRIARAIVAQLPERAIELSDAFAASDGPVLTDQAHTNELGALLVARAMYPHLAPALADLARGTDGRLVTIAP